MNPYLIATASLCAASSAFAAQPTPTAQPFDTLTVTATRTAQTVNQALASVTIITREQIERMQATDLADILRFASGVEIARSGGSGQITSIFTRGTESDHTLVLVDGMKINPGTLGSANISYIHPDNIERIEIVKGPRSTLYGSEAMGGVIQILTRQKGPAFSARATLGSNDTKEAAIQAFHTTTQGSQLGFNLNTSSTQGIPTLHSSEVDSGYDNVNARVMFAHAFDNTDLKFSLLHSNGNTEYLDFFSAPVDQDFTQLAINLDVDTQVTNNWLSRIKLGLFNDKLDQNQSPDFAHTRRRQIEWQNDYDLADHSLTAGISLQRETIESLSFGSGFGQVLDTRAVYLQDNMHVGKHSLVVAARYTDHETFGNHTTWETSYGYQATPDLNLYASIATAFRAPNASDLYGFGGNLSLEPETSKNYEIGAKYQIDAHNHLNAAAFYNKIDNLITTVEIAPFTYEGRNVNEVLIKGIELGHQLSVNNLIWNTSVVIQSPHDEASDSTLLRRAHRTLSSSVDYNIGKYQLGAHLLAQSQKKDTPNDVDGYGVVNLTVSKQLNANVTIEGKLLNVTDKEYEQVSRYNTQGRSGLITLKITL